MRKFTLMFVALIMATLAFAQKQDMRQLGDVKAFDRSTTFSTPVPAQKLNLKQGPTKKIVRKGAPRKISSIDDIAGTYVAAHNYYSVENQQLVDNEIPAGSSEIEIVKVDENTISITGLLPGNYPNQMAIEATVDFDEGKFTIAQNQIIMSTSYGDVVMGNPLEDADFEGTIFDDGLSIDDLWYDFLSGGDYDGYMYTGLIYGTTILEPNGKMNFTNSENGAQTANVYVYQPENSNAATVFNFGGQGYAIDVTLKEDGAFVIEQQLVEDYSSLEDNNGNSYGKFYFYGVTDDGYIASTYNGTGTEKELDLSQKWTFWSPTSGYVIGGINSDSKITLTGEEIFAYPVIEDVAAVPAQPSIVTVRDYNPTNGYGAMFADIPVTDVKGNAIKESKLYYAVYTRIGEVEEQYVFTPEEYENLTESLSEMPYSFIDGYDFGMSTDGYRYIYFNHDYSNVDYFGIQSIYYGGGECNKSDISWFRFRIPTVELPDGVKTTVYTMTGSIQVENDEGEYEDEEYTSTVYVGIDGSDFYIQGLCPLIPDAWLKGSIDGTTVTIPTGQYYGKYTTSSASYNLFFAGVDLENSGAICDFIFEYDDEADTYLSFNAAGIALTEDASSGIVDAIYPIIILNPIPDVPATPSSPYDLKYNPWDEESGYASIQFKLDALDDEENPIIPDKLFYQFFSEIQDVQAPVVFTSEYYVLLEESGLEQLPIIPYTLDDDYDFDNRRTTTGYMHVFLNDPVVKTYEKIGIRSIYTGGTDEDEPQTSEIVWLDIKEANGIEDGIAVGITDKKIVGVTYSDLSGRRVLAPRHGVYVKTITYSDGTTRTVKSLVK